jgi:hypothetical protein
MSVYGKAASSSAAKTISAGVDRGLNAFRLEQRRSSIAPSLSTLLRREGYATVAPEIGPILDELVTPTAQPAPRQFLCTPARGRGRRKRNCSSPRRAFGQCVPAFVAAERAFGQTLSQPAATDAAGWRAMYLKLLCDAFRLWHQAQGEGATLEKDGSTKAGPSLTGHSLKLSR